MGIEKGRTRQALSPAKRGDELTSLAKKRKGGGEGGEVRSLQGKPGETVSGNKGKERAHAEGSTKKEKGGGGREVLFPTVRGKRGRGAKQKKKKKKGEALRNVAKKKEGSFAFKTAPRGGEVDARRWLQEKKKALWSTRPKGGKEGKRFRLSQGRSRGETQSRRPRKTGGGGNALPHTLLLKRGGGGRRRKKKKNLLLIK